MRSFGLCGFLGILYLRTAALIVKPKQLPFFPTIPGDIPRSDLWFLKISANFFREKGPQMGLFGGKKEFLQKSHAMTCRYLERLDLTKTDQSESFKMSLQSLLHSLFVENIKNIKHFYSM